MGMVAPGQRIASAFVVTCGAYGAVTRQADERGVCRQRLYRESAAVVVAIEGTAHRQQIEELEQRVRDLQARVAELVQRFSRAVLLDEDKQAEFAATSQAEGVSLPVAWRLLRVLLEKSNPSVAKMGRWTKAASDRATALLAVLDEYSRPLVQQAAADEIYVGGKPILMVVEQVSLCWQSGRLAEHADGANWTQEFQAYPALTQVSRDAGTGLGKGLATVNAKRQQEGLSAVGDQLDHFHTLREGNRALRITKLRAQRAMTTADEAQTELARLERHGQPVAGHATHVAVCWRRAEQCLDDWSHKEQAWQRVQKALRLYTPNGELNDRTGAEAQLAEVLPVLTGAEWAKTKRLLRRAETFTFLERVHKQMTNLPIAREIRDAAVRSEGLRRHPELLQGDNTQAAVTRGLALVWGLILAKAGAAGQAAIDGVRDVLRQTWRASSLVEGINSVVRMQQARHRRMTQGLLDLKRLYWNTREFRTGKRKSKSPYEHLGLRIPNGTWWELLKFSPEQLREQLSAPP
jgi:hypothetical protein